MLTDHLPDFSKPSMVPGRFRYGSLCLVSYSGQAPGSSLIQPSSTLLTHTVPNTQKATSKSFEAIQ